jgi:hypothetical protein
MPVRREDEGASAGGCGGTAANRSKELRPLSDTLFLAPLLALIHSGCLVRERPESGGIECAYDPTPTLRPHCPVFSSSDFTASGKALTRGQFLDVTFGHTRQLPAWVALTNRDLPAFFRSFRPITRHSGISP